MTNTRLTPTELRRRSFTLMRQCWKLLLLAAVLMSFFNWAEDAVKGYGEAQAQAVYDAHMANFYAENPCPEDENAAFMWAYFDEWFAKHDAEEASEETLLPWKISGFAFALLDDLFSGVILVGLYTGLLMLQRGGECTLHCLSMGFSRWKQAFWLTLRVSLNTAGWVLLAMIPALILDSHWGAFGNLLGSIIIVCVALWAEMHYALSFLHMADDPDGQLTATACIHNAVDNMNFFTVRGFLRTTWPTWALLTAEFLLGAAAIFLPIPRLLLKILSDFLIICSMMLLCPACACVYEELRTHQQTPETPGAVRARALAAGEDYAEDPALLP